MEQNQVVIEEEKGISLGDIFFLIKKYFLLILIITLVCTIAGAVYGLKFKKITYTAKAEAIVMANSSTSAPTASSNYQEYVMSTYLINTFNTFIVSNKVVRAVAEDLSEGLEAYKANNPDAVLPENYKTLSNEENIGSMIKKIQDNATISTSTNSLIITIKFKSSNEALSIVVTNLLVEKTKEIADAYVEVDSKKVYDYEMLAGNFALVDEAEPSTVSASRGASIVIIVSALIGLVISFAIILIKYLCDDTYTSKEAFEKAFNINVLTLLPDFNETEEKGGKK